MEQQHHQSDLLRQQKLQQEETFRQKLLEQQQQQQEKMQEQLRMAKQMQQQLEQLHSSSKLTPRARSESPSREINMLHKRMPKFSGLPNENYNAWAMNSTMHLGEYPNLTEEQKVKVILFKLDGYPREIVANKNLTTVSEIFQILNVTYGQNVSSLLASVRQLPDEPVKIYLSRLKTTLSMLGYKEETDPNSPNEVYQDFFTKGLLPQLRSRVQYLLPDNLNSAVSKAMHAEHELATKDGGKFKKNVDFLTTCQTSSTMDEPATDKTSELLTTMQQLTQRITEALPVRRVETAPRNFNNASSAWPRNNSSKPPYRPRNCFGCQRPGHSYRVCRSISEQERQRIGASLPALIDAQKKKNAEQQSALNSRTAPAQPPAML